MSNSDFRNLPPFHQPNRSIVCKVVGVDGAQFYPDLLSAKIKASLPIDLGQVKNLPTSQEGGD